jgi:hypothetical protein
LKASDQKLKKAERPMRKFLILTGIVLILTGVLLPCITRLPFGRLPGDVMISRPGFRFYFPITTMIIVSAVISLIAWLMNR